MIYLWILGKIMEEKLLIHYYFNDNTHKMNAFIRNKAEKDLLDSFKQVSEVLNIELKVESEAYTEGGLFETFNLTTPQLAGAAIAGVAGVAMYFKPSVNKLITYYFTEKSDEKNKLEIELKKEQLKTIQLDNLEKERELNNSNSEDVFDDPYILRHVSNFYKQLNNYSKIEKVGFSYKKNEEEIIVPKNDFQKYILVDDTTEINDENADIEIISPVLNTGRYKWRGQYKNEVIDFSMGDTKFKTEIAQGKYHFANGTIINCNLKITIKTNELGEDKKSYSVKEVYGTKESPSSQLILREIGKRKKHEKWVDEHTGNLFEEE